MSTGQMTLLRLALENLRRKPFRTYALAVAVAIAAGAVFATSTVMWGVERSLHRGFSKFGADLLVVPHNALVNMKAALLTGEPSTFYMGQSVMREVQAVAGIDKVTPQIFLTTADGAHCSIGNAFLVGYDPATDFTVEPWLTERPDRPMRADEVVIGGNNPYEPGQLLYFYGQQLSIYGKLERTGIGLYDNAIFLHQETAYRLAEVSRRMTDVAPLGFHQGEVSALLVRVGDTAKANLVRFAIAKNPNVKVIAAGNVVTSVRQNLAALFGGTVVLSAVLVIGNALMIGAIFTGIVNERRRELGLLRAVGARRRAVFGLMVTEAALLTAGGGLAGVAFGALLMRLFHRTMGFHLESLNIPFLWPSPLGMLGLAAGCVLLSLLIGLLGAAYPAAAGSRIEPYDAIRQGE